MDLFKKIIKGVNNFIDPQDKLAPLMPQQQPQPQPQQLVKVVTAKPIEPEVPVAGMSGLANLRLTPEDMLYHVALDSNGIMHKNKAIKMTNDPSMKTAGGGKVGMPAEVGEVFIPFMQEVQNNPYIQSLMPKGIAVSEVYRPYGVQVTTAKNKPKLAAMPGTSNHGFYRAFDGNFVEMFQKDASNVLKKAGVTTGVISPGFFSNAKNKQKFDNYIRTRVGEGTLDPYIGTLLDVNKYEPQHLYYRTLAFLAPSYRIVQKAGEKHGAYNPFEESLMNADIAKGKTIELWHWEVAGNPNSDDIDTFVKNAYKEEPNKYLEWHKYFKGQRAGEADKYENLAKDKQTWRANRVWPLPQQTGTANTDFQSKYKK